LFFLMSKFIFNWVKTLLAASVHTFGALAGWAGAIFVAAAELVQWVGGRTHMLLHAPERFGGNAGRDAGGHGDAWVRRIHQPVAGKVEHGCGVVAHVGVGVILVDRLGGCVRHGFTVLLFYYTHNKIIKAVCSKKTVHIVKNVQKKQVGRVAPARR
jgi:hypothetical protein